MSLLKIMTAPWAIVPAKLGEICEIYVRHLRGEKLDRAQIEARIGAQGGAQKLSDQGYQVANGVAVIPIDGIIAQRMNLFMDIFGGTSTNLLTRDFKKALADPTVQSILFAIDSPGGSVAGTAELAQMIFEARGQKPVNAFTDGMMASAAYWIGSAADQIYISGDTTQVGSIGVVATHEDISRWEANMGIKTTEITAGKYKRIASQYAPLSDAGRADIQTAVDYIYSVFVNDVARNRGVSAETVLINMADGRDFIGRQALAAGLVDGVTTLDALIADMAQSSGRQANGRPQIKTDAPKTHQSKQEGKTMEIKVEGNLTAAFVSEKFPEIAEALRAEGRTAGIQAGRMEGAAAERARIADVEKQLMPGHEALINTLKFDGKTTGPEAAAKVLETEKVKRKNVSEAIEKEAPLPVPHVNAPEPKKTADPNLPVEERAKIEWDSSEAIRGEFKNFERYLGWKKAESEGRAKILNAKK